MSRPVDYRDYNFTEDQITDLEILMGLSTSEEISEWIHIVGNDDVCYGLTLLECASLAVLDNDTSEMKIFPKARTVINHIRGMK
jgi:hypothetical protein